MLTRQFCRKSRFVPVRFGKQGTIRYRYKHFLHFKHFGNVFIFIGFNIAHIYSEFNQNLPIYPKFYILPKFVYTILCILPFICFVNDFFLLLYPQTDRVTE